MRSFHFLSLSLSLEITSFEVAKIIGSKSQYTLSCIHLHDIEIQLLAVDLVYSIMLVEGLYRGGSPGKSPPCFANNMNISSCHSSLIPLPPNLKPCMKPWLHELNIC